MKNELSKKIVFFLITMVLFVCVFLLAFFLEVLVEKLIPSHPYVKLGYYLILMCMDAFITKRVMYSASMTNWMKKF